MEFKIIFNESNKNNPKELVLNCSIKDLTKQIEKNLPSINLEGKNLNFWVEDKTGLIFLCGETKGSKKAVIDTTESFDLINEPFEEELLKAGISHDGQTKEFNIVENALIMDIGCSTKTLKIKYAGKKVEFTDDEPLIGFPTKGDDINELVTAALKKTFKGTELIKRLVMEAACHDMFRDNEYTFFGVQLMFNLK